jgi:hypothetical protein
MEQVLVIAGIVVLIFGSLIVYSMVGKKEE